MCEKNLRWTPMNMGSMTVAFRSFDDSLKQNWCGIVSNRPSSPLQEHGMTYRVGVYTWPQTSPRMVRKMERMICEEVASVSAVRRNAVAPL